MNNQDTQLTHCDKIELGNPGKNVFTRSVFNLVKPVINLTLAMKDINRHYRGALALDPGESFGGRVLKSMNVKLDVCAEEIQSVPVDQPLVIISNHPFGGIEALALDAVFEHLREDMKYIANFILTSIPEYRERMFAVDPFGGRSAAKRNFSGVRQAIKWIKDGHALTVFPAGEVSHLHFRNRKVMDGPWNNMAARIIQTSHCSVIPVFFHGQNSRLFQTLGLLHPGFRTLLLCRELMKKENTTISLRIGSVIKPEKCAQFETPEELTDYLRMRTYILQKKENLCKKVYLPRIIRKKSKPLDPVIPAIDKIQLISAIESLPGSQCLVDKSPMKVFYFLKEQAPVLLEEIGRLREITFREVGEGSGKSKDIDKFDEYYIHLIVWDTNEKEIVGAYRAGQTDLILGQAGKKGLYTSTLFQFKKKLLQEVYPALELGRSFVQPKYQRHFSSLMLLWKGIGEYVVQNPRYRYLMGPVSISREYSDTSRFFLKHFLQANYGAPELARKVKPIKPLKLKHSKTWTQTTTQHVVQSVNDVDELIRDMEKELNGIPVLLRQYLKLEAKLLGFNIDPDFCNVLDALLLIDLKQVPLKILKRYMTVEGAKSFLETDSEEVSVIR